MDARDLDTPALYVDVDALERNIARMQERCRAWGVALRPHVKTHKISEIAQLQLAAGAIGITVAKVGEAEVLPGDDVLIAYPLVKAKLPRVRELAKTRRVKVAVDSVEVARDLQRIETLVEIDVGVGRTGAQSPEQAVAIARACSDSNFRGIFYWPSWLDEAGFRAACVKIDAVLAALARAGFEAKIVSGGSTPGAAKTPLIPQTTEIRPGTYVFYDASSAAAPPDPSAIPIDVRIRPAGAPPESRWNSQKPDTSVIRATIGRMTGRRRRISAAISFPPSGPASASAGIRKNVWNAIMPTHNAPKNTWAKRRMSITCDSLSS